MRFYFIMSTIAGYLGANPMLSDDRMQVDRVPDEWRAFLPERFDATAFRAFRVPLPVCAGFWTQQVLAGLEMLRPLAHDRLLTLRYEDILADPKRQLDTLTAFLGEEFVDEDWSVRCAATVRPPRSTWRDLPEDEAGVLTEACRPGFEMLREVGVEYDV